VIAHLGPGADPQSVTEFLDSLVANALMITDGTNYLSLAVHTPPRWMSVGTAAPTNVH
jgi:hypothetical protein